MHSSNDPRGNECFLPLPSARAVKLSLGFNGRMVVVHKAFYSDKYKINGHCASGSASQVPIKKRVLRQST